MSQDIAIRVENVSKHYFLGRPRTGKSLRQVAEDLMFWPVNIVKSLFSKNSTDSESPPSLWALADIDFELAHGEMLGIIGKNGSGKSTLLKIISRLTPPTTGRVSVTGRVSSLLEVGVGFNYELSGRENIYLNGAIMGMTTPEIEEKLDRIVAFAELERFVDTPVKHYSSGMYMRLAFSVAAHLDPDILILDEVLAVGDIQFQRRCLEKLQDVRNRGCTIILVSHSMEPILELCNQAICLQSGRIVAMGDPRMVVQQYLEINPDARMMEKPRMETLPKNASSLAEPVENRGIRLHSVKVEAALREDSTLGQDTPFTLLAHYETLEAFEDLRLCYRLYDENERLLLHTALPEPGDLHAEAGPKSARVDFPSGWLEPGHYQIEILFESEKHSWQWSERCCRVRIVNTELQGLGTRVLRPNLSWQIATRAEAVQ